MICDPEVVEAIHKVAYYVYEQGSQYDVYRLADLLNIPYGLCVPCEDQTPWLGNACLVCGSSDDLRGGFQQKPKHLRGVNHG